MSPRGNNLNEIIMKKFVLATALLFFSVATMQAQQKRSGERPRQEQQGPKAQMSASDRAKIEAKEMTLQLDLNDDQQAKAEVALLEFHTQMESLKKSIEKPRKDFTQEEKTEMKSQHLDAQIALKEDMKEILNADQYEQFSKRIGNLNKKRGPKRSKK